MQSRRKNIYVRCLSRMALLLLYFFLLTPQCHSRFYSIANFYLFAPKQACISATGNNALSNSTQAKTQHLSLDKRFRNAQAYATNLLVPEPVIALCSVVVATQTQTSFPVLSQAFISNAWIKAVSLRGPPCA